MSRPRVIAHRGASGERPENTLSAYELAVEQGADMIEIDLHCSRDGVVVIHHDAELAALGLPGEIADHPAAVLRDLDVSRGRGAPERMPTLAEVLDDFGARVELNLEIKQPVRGSYAGIEAIALGQVEERGLRERMLFSSFSDGVLGRLRGLSAEARLAVLVSPRARWRSLQRAERVRAEALHPHVGLVTPERVRRAHRAGLRVHPYTEDDPAGMERLLDAGVDGIVTNHPERLWSLLTGRGLGAPHAGAAS